MTFFTKKPKQSGSCGDQRVIKECKPTVVGKLDECRISHEFVAEGIDLGTLHPGYVVDLFATARAAAHDTLSRISQARSILDASEATVRDALCHADPACVVKHHGK